MLTALAGFLAIMLALLGLPSLGAAQTPGSFDFVDADPTFGERVLINRAGGGTTLTEPSRFVVTVTTNGTVYAPNADYCIDLDVGMTVGQTYQVLVENSSDAPELNDANFRSIGWLLARTPALIDAASDKGLEAGALQLAVWMLIPGQADPADPLQPANAREVALEVRAIELYNEALGKGLTTLAIASDPSTTTPGSSVALNLTGTPDTTADLAITSGNGTLGASQVTFNAAGQASTTLTSPGDGQVTVQATTEAGEIRRVIADPERGETPEVQRNVYLVPASASTTVTFETPPPPPPPPPAPPSGGTSGTPVTPVTPVGSSNNVCLRPNLRVQVMGTRRAKAGNTYKYKVKVTNRSNRHVAEMVSVRIVVPRGYSVVRRPRGSRISRGSVIVPLRNIGPNRMRMTMVTLRADRDTAGRTAVRAFVSAKCSRRRAGVLRIRTSPLVQRVSPAVTG